MSRLEELEEASLYEEDTHDLPPHDIVAYNELRSCADLYRMHQQSILEIHPEFQRDVVWKGPMQTRFIDSLVKQLPIPSMCFAYDYRQQKWIVIDGLQRMATIIQFLKGADWTLSCLDDVDPELSGKSVAAIRDTDSPVHKFYTRVENLSIPITVLRCDFSKRNHLEYLFTIFHRLNTGGMKLNNQEIRNCIFSGGLNNLLKELDKHTTWRRLNRMKPNESYRLTKQELILRYFAFEDDLEKYTGHLAKFLNDYMHMHRNADEVYLGTRSERFRRVVKVLFEEVYDKNPPSKISITLMEAALVGIGRNIDSIQASPPGALRERMNELTKHDEFSEKSLTEGLSKRQRVVDRLNVAVRILGARDK